MSADGPWAGQMNRVARAAGQGWREACPIPPPVVWIGDRTPVIPTDSRSHHPPGHRGLSWEFDVTQSSVIKKSVKFVYPNGVHLLIIVDSSSFSAAAAPLIPLYHRWEANDTLKTMHHQVLCFESKSKFIKAGPLRLLWLCGAMRVCPCVPSCSV